MNAALKQLIRRFEQDFTGEFNPRRLSEWMPVLRAALASEYASDPEIVEQAEKLLSVRFRSIAKGVKKRHRINLAKLGPEIVAEHYRPLLADRIRASADLIRLNRDEEIGRQLKRFAGWASGGLPDQRKRDRSLERGVRKSLSQLSFERRRVCIDQGHKLMAAIDDVIAKDHGAIAKRWRHVIPHAGYQSRKEHLERDRKVYSVKGKRDKGPYVEDLPDQPALLPFCSCWWESIYDESDL